MARRLLELSPKPEVATQARKVIKFAEKNDSDAKPLDYDERNPFEICNIDYKPIYRGSPSCKCPYCGAKFNTSYRGRTCTVCTLAKIGMDVPGLQFLASRK